MAISDTCAGDPRAFCRFSLWLSVCATIKVQVHMPGELAVASISHLQKVTVAATATLWSMPHTTGREVGQLMRCPEFCN